MGLGTMLHEMEKITHVVRYPSFEVLVGQTLKSVEGLDIGSEEVILETIGGLKYKLYHCQDCCESVSINDVVNDVEDFDGALILSAEEVVGVTPTDYVWDYEPESYTWTFYKIETDRGGVFIRWLGESNGHYGEGVSFERIQ